MLCRISDFEIEKLSLSKSKDATYLQADKQPFELQTGWLTLGKYPLPSKKFIENDTKWINATVPIKKNDDSYIFFTAIDNNLSRLKILSSGKYHYLVSQNDKPNEFFLKFKLYPNTALFDKDKIGLALHRSRIFTDISEKVKPSRLSSAFRNYGPWDNSMGARCLLREFF